LTFLTTLNKLCSVTTTKEKGNRTVKQQLNNQRGAAHLVLILALVVGLVGVLGFLGYNAWQKQSADAGGESTLARGGHGADGEPLLKCLSSISASPLPNYQTSSTYKVKVEAPNRDARVRFGVTYNTSHHGLTKFGSWTTVKKGNTKTLRFARATPRTVHGEAVTKAALFIEDGSGSQLCGPKFFGVSPVAD